MFVSFKKKKFFFGIKLLCFMSMFHAYQKHGIWDSGRAHDKEYFPELLLPVSLSPQRATATTCLCRRHSDTSRLEKLVLQWLGIQGCSNQITFICVCQFEENPELQLISCVADRVLVLRPGVRPVPLRRESRVRALVHQRPPSSM